MSISAKSADDLFPAGLLQTSARESRTEETSAPPARKRGSTRSGTCSVPGCGKPTYSQHKLCTDHQRGGRGKGSRRNGRGTKGRSARLCITDAEWLAMYEHQHGRCGICDYPLYNRFSETPRNKKTHHLTAVDHDEDLRKRLVAEGMDPREAMRKSIRGLACMMPCNRNLHEHMYVERCLWLHQAIAYCEVPPAQEVLK